MVRSWCPAPPFQSPLFQDPSLQLSRFDSPPCVSWYRSKILFCNSLRCPNVIFSDFSPPLDLSVSLLSRAVAPFNRTPFPVPPSFLISLFDRFCSQSDFHLRPGCVGLPSTIFSAPAPEKFSHAVFAFRDLVVGSFQPFFPVFCFSLLREA